MDILFSKMDICDNCGLEHCTCDTICCECYKPYNDCDCYDDIDMTQI